MPFFIVVCIIVFIILRLYNSVWRFASFNELFRSVVAWAICSVFNIILTLVFFERMPVSYYLFGGLLHLIFIVGVRFSYRFVHLMRSSKGSSGARNVMIIGAGEAGHMVLRDIRHTSKIHENVSCIIDDNPEKWGRIIDGVLITGGREKIQECVEQYNISKIYFAIPTASAEDKKEILSLCNETGCELKRLPGLYELELGNVTVNQMRNVSVEDLLGREPIEVKMNEVYDFIHDKTVLVTGGGGSIGSEICRQVALHSPKSLIIFDIYENNAYEIQQELKNRYPDMYLNVIIGSVRDSRKLMNLFSTYHPDVVYHAAAHKHVPLMEDSPCEAIKNNVIGTYKTAYAAMIYGCSRFVLISSDKAVNPTNIMGASKRLCEMIIQSFDCKIKEGKAGDIPFLFSHKSEEGVDISKRELRKLLAGTHTEFVAVRFGNVLGSNGSVIPLFKKQIEQGGPVTVTHPDIVRYFMTIREAVNLVLLAGTYAHVGEIFVLDMGEPVKIVDLARNLIRFSGFVPDEDIKIKYIGLRPGEKLYEEKMMDEEGLRQTSNKMIHICQPLVFNNDEFFNNLEDLMNKAYNNDPEIKYMVADIVGTYTVEKTKE
ncbi:MAG: polysaccharide biosynthesis protein [Erysipelotrichaceae bacterium]|nr:polysaccharide biosynthesis protein [Erysipelotrichaceae bacterium]